MFLALFGIITRSISLFISYRLFQQILYQNLLLGLKDLSDKGRHRDYAFHWQGNGNARKKCLLHMSSTVFELMTGFKVTLLTKLHRIFVSNFTPISSRIENDEKII